MDAVKLTGRILTVRLWISLNYYPLCNVFDYFLIVPAEAIIILKMQIPRR